MEDKIYTIEVDYFDQGLIQEKNYDVIINAVEFMGKSIISGMKNRGCEIFGVTIVEVWTLKDYIVNASIASEVDVIISEASINNR